MSTVSAQTTYEFEGGDLTVAANWDPDGLPTGVNDGTVAVNGTSPAASGAGLVDYNITQSAGTISNADFSGTKHDGGSWDLNGGTFATRAHTLTGGHVMTIDGGTANLGNNNRDVSLGTASELILESGTLNFGRRLIGGGGTFTMNGGVLVGDTDTWIGANSFNGVSTFNFNGGDADFLEFNNAKTGQVVRFGGSTAGTVDTTALISGTAGVFDWTAGSLMELTMAGASLSYYETLYTDGILLFENSNVDPFASNFAVSGATLSLVPEPSAYGLLAGMLCLGWVATRRRA